VNAPERSRAYIELDSDTIRATTPVEFRQLLDRIRQRAGLTPSQIAVKTTIPRSQAYNMVAVGRTTLPSKPEQVREFVEACGLAPVHVGLVMSLWSMLDQQAREQAAGRALSLIDGGAASDTMQITRSVVGEATVPFPVLFEDSPKYRRKGPAPARRKRAASDLLFLVLDDASRTRRALLLLLPIVVTYVAIVVILVVWAMLQPGHFDIIGGIIASVIIFPAVGLGRLMAGSRR